MLCHVEQVQQLIVMVYLKFRQGNLKQCLISQGITTVGQMARLTESDIDLLPIKAPKLSTTLKAFKKSGATKNPSAKPSSRGMTLANGKLQVNFK